MLLKVLGVIMWALKLVFHIKAPKSTQEWIKDKSKVSFGKVIQFTFK